MPAHSVPEDPGRAKRWGTTPYVAQLLANTVGYYRDTDAGKNAFRKWIEETYPMDATRKLRFLHLKPRESQNVPPQAEVLYKASLELGVHMETLKEYHKCSVMSDKMELIAPSMPPTPAPWRKANEPGHLWFARRQLSQQDGCLRPQFLFTEALSIATSEADRLEDTLTLWRTTPASWVESVKRRAGSTLPSKTSIEECKGSEELLKQVQADDAARSNLFISTIAWNAWSYVADLFEDLARDGLTTQAAIEAAYNKDHLLLWRLLTALTRVENLLLHQWSRLIQALSVLPRFSPYLKRYRDDEGYANLTRDDTYILNHGYGEEDKLFSPLIDAIIDGSDMMRFLPRLATYMSRAHLPYSVFTQEALDFLGDYSVSNEWMDCVSHTTFGENILRAARKLESRPEEKPAFSLAISAINLLWLMRWVENVTPLSRSSHGLATRLNETASDILRHILALAKWKELGFLADPRWHAPDENAEFFDDMWDQIDYTLAMLVALHRHEEGPMRLIRDFHIVLHDPNMPRAMQLKACDFFFNELDPSQKQQLKPRTAVLYERPDPFAQWRPPKTAGDAPVVTVEGGPVASSDLSSAPAPKNSPTSTPEDGKVESLDDASSGEPGSDQTDGLSSTVDGAEDGESRVESKWDVVGMFAPETLLPVHPLAPKVTWESLVSDKTKIVWSDEPEPEWFTQALTSHPRWDSYVAQPVPPPKEPLPEPKLEPEPELDLEPPANDKGKKKKKGKGPLPPPTPKKVKAKPPPPPPPPPRPRTPPPDIPDHPEVMPDVFQVPRKSFKVFQPLMGSADNVGKKPQIKWADFERAMRRLGFATVDSMGSLVRFDPPALTARPIAFFRPQPATNPIPDLDLKIMGARLKKCYAWSANTFELAAAAEDGKGEDGT